MTTKLKLKLIGLGGLVVVAIVALVFVLPHRGDSVHQDKGEEHSGHDFADPDENEEDVIRLSEQEMREFGIEVAVAGPGRLEMSLSLPGEVRLNADAVAHITPRAAGVVREVHAKLGDAVKSGQALALLASREIAEVKASYLSILETLALAEAAYKREESLWKEKRITSEQEYLDAKQTHAQARIERRAAENKLHALGFSDTDLQKLPEEPDETYTHLEIVAPRDGIIIEKHITLGEVLRDDSNIFTLADLSTVWVDMQVYPRDLPHVQKGVEVEITADAITHSEKGTVSYLSPIVDEHTRTALARVVLPNRDGKWRPGLFVTGRLTGNFIPVKVLIPRTALQDVEGKLSVFVETGEGFEPTPVILGRTNETHVEVVKGLNAGQRYAAKGSFTLKSEMQKAAFGHGGHGH